jgi:hypothetical protein
MKSNSKLTEESNQQYIPKRINSIKYAKAMDVILDLCIKYYVGIGDQITFYTIEKELNERFKFHSYESEFVIKIMIESNQIKAEYENNSMKHVYCDVIGFEKYISGGFANNAKRQKNERRLILIGQISAGIAGVYYLIVLLKEILECLCQRI